MLDFSRDSLIGSEPSGEVMETIAISKFKATCLAVLEKVRKTGQPVLVTRFGHPMVQIEPALGPPRIKLGTGIGEMRIVGDIVGPISDESEWEAAHGDDEETSE